MSSKPRQRHTLLDLLEGFYISRILDALHEEGVLSDLAKQKPLSRVARTRGLDLSMLRSLLEYVAVRSDVIRVIQSPSGKRFTLGAKYAGSSSFAHHLDQYIGAYGPCLDGLRSILKSRDVGKERVDRRRHAKAFDHAAEGTNHVETAAIVRELGITTLLDLGCGTGQLLKALAKESKSFRGIGVDASEQMLKAGRREANAMRVNKRLRFFQGDASKCGEMLDERSREKVQAITAISLLNGYFEDGQDGAIQLLRHLQKYFPARIMIIGDYYGCLGAPYSRQRGQERTLLHDVAQLVSGQGIPPHNRLQWEKIYRRAGCTLIKVLEGHSDRVTRFIHLIQL